MGNSEDSTESLRRERLNRIRQGLPEIGRLLEVQQSDADRDAIQVSAPTRLVNETPSARRWSFSRAVQKLLADELRRKYERFRQLKDKDYVADRRRHGPRFWMRVLNELVLLDVDPIDYIWWTMDFYAYPMWPSGLLASTSKESYLSHHSETRQSLDLQRKRDELSWHVNRFAYECFSPDGPRQDLAEAVRARSDAPALLRWCIAVCKRQGDLELVLRPDLVPFVLDPAQRAAYQEHCPREIAVLRAMLAADEMNGGMPPFLSSKPLFPTTPSRDTVKGSTTPTGETGNL